MKRTLVLFVVVAVGMAGLATAGVVESLPAAAQEANSIVVPFGSAEDRGDFVHCAVFVTPSSAVPGGWKGGV